MGDERRLHDGDHRRLPVLRATASPPGQTPWIRHPWRLAHIPVRLARPDASRERPARRGHQQLPAGSTGCDGAHHGWTLRRNGAVLGRRRPTHPGGPRLRDGGRDARRRLDRRAAGRHAGGRADRPTRGGGSDAGPPGRRHHMDCHPDPGEGVCAGMGCVPELVQHARTDRVLWSCLSTRDSADLRSPRQHRAQTLVQRDGVSPPDHHRVGVPGRGARDRAARRRRSH